jgi:excisionase family DNA binding protein
MKNAEQLCTRAELATRLGVSPGTIYNWTRWGQIRSHKLGPRQVRYVLAEVKEDLGIEVI